MKASYVVQEVLDERGRYISPSEFRWIISKFKDRYDPRRLSMSLAYTCGLRIKDAIRARLKWFSKDFTEMKMSQCKPHVSKEDGVVHIKNKPRFVPLPSWLSTDFRNYITYRLMLGWYVGESLEDFRLFPKLKRNVFDTFFQYLREKYGKEQAWLKDVWMIVKRYDSKGNLIESKKWFRVATHACRANYVTSSYEVTNKDIVATKTLSGHSDLRDLERYIKISGITELKKEICDRFMSPLTQIQNIPLLTGQTKLEMFK